MAPRDSTTASAADRAPAVSRFERRRLVRDGRRDGRRRRPPLPDPRDGAGEFTVWTPRMIAIAREVALDCAVLAEDLAAELVGIDERIAAASLIVCDHLIEYCMREGRTQELLESQIADLERVLSVASTIEPEPEPGPAELSGPSGPARRADPVVLGRARDRHSAAVRAHRLRQRQQRERAARAREERTALERHRTGLVALAHRRAERARALGETRIEIYRTALLDAHPRRRELDALWRPAPLGPVLLPG